MTSAGVSGYCGTSGCAEVMIFYPTMEEFRDFEGYIKQIEQSGAHLKCGICKIVPPEEWTPRPKRGKAYDDIGDIVITSPISQQVEGERGCFTQFNTTFKKKLPVSEYEKLAKSAKYAAPPFANFAEMERYYWRNVTYGRPIYGADFRGSLYDDEEVDTWNINRLPSILDILQTDEGQKISIEGVNNAYMYYGMWKATFPWHTEDMDLYSINYIHFGAPKFWYGISEQHRDKFERLAEMFFPQSKQQCKAFLRHKMYLISPTVLKQNCVPFGTMVQKAGEIMITFPGGYHAGFNVGYNAAESTNFASERWIDFGKKANFCTCRSDTVRINMAPFIERFRPQEWADYKYWYIDRVENQKSGKEVKPETEKGRMESAVSKRNPLACPAHFPRKRHADDDDDEIDPKKESTDREYWEQRLREEGVISDDDGSDSEHGSIGLDKKNLTLRMWEDAEFERKQRDAVPIVKPSTNSEREKALNPTENKEYESLWTWNEQDIEAEKNFNLVKSMADPHCSICQYFVPASLGKESEFLPAQSRKLIMDLCFHRNPTTPNVVRREVHAKDVLQTCVGCGVTVHSSCYGESKPLVPGFLKTLGSADPGIDEQPDPDWKCLRCDPSSSIAKSTVMDDTFESDALPSLENKLLECKLCPLRGGAMQQTTDNDLVHVICALYNHESVEFKSYERKWPVKLKCSTGKDSAYSECIFCHTRIGQTIPCSHTECEPQNYFHATCGRLGGVNYELRDWPLLLGAVCPHHDDQAEAEGLSPLNNDDKVIAWLEEGAIVVRGRVIETKSVTFCVVDFDDGSFTNDIYTNDIVKCSCSEDNCEGAHVSGARVTVRWPDGTQHSGVFRRAYTAKMYRVELQDPEGSEKTREVDCSRSDLYGPKEFLPQLVRDKLLEVRKKQLARKKDSKPAAPTIQSIHEEEMRMKARKEAELSKNGSTIKDTPKPTVVS